MPMIVTTLGSVGLEQIRRSVCVREGGATFKFPEEKAGVMMRLWRTQSSPSTMTKPFPNMGSLSRLKTVGLPHALDITTPFDTCFRNPGSPMYRNGSVPNQ